MNCFPLSCNIQKCRVPLCDSAWVTRCMHVFCPGHGQAYFSSASPQVYCPVCNELNIKEVDILLCDTNPTDVRVYFYLHILKITFRESTCHEYQYMFNKLKWRQQYGPYCMGVDISMSYDCTVNVTLSLAPKYLYCNWYLHLESVTHLSWN